MNQNQNYPKENSMRIARLYGIRDLRLETSPIPQITSDEVLLKVASVGICGSDVHYYLEGRIGDQHIVDPLILGHEFSALVENPGKFENVLPAGRLVAVDPAIPCGVCESCQHGNPNLCPTVKFCGSPGIDGACAEYITMPAKNCIPLPEGFTPDDGVLLETLGIAIHSVDLASLKPGYTVAILGAGPIGLLTAAVAKAAGASEIYMTEPIAYRRQFALDTIADEALDPFQTDIVAEILNRTGGRGVDVAFEAAGAAGTPAQAAEITRPGGKVIVSGIPSDDTIMLKAGTVRRKGLTIKLVRRMKHTYPRAIHMVQTGMVNIKPLVTQSFPFNQVERAFNLASTRAEGVFKVTLHIDQ